MENVGSHYANWAVHWDVAAWLSMHAVGGVASHAQGDAENHRADTHGQCVRHMQMRPLALTDAPRFGLNQAARDGMPASTDGGPSDARSLAQRAIQYFGDSAERSAKFEGFGAGYCAGSCYRGR